MPLMMRDVLNLAPSGLLMLTTRDSLSISEGPPHRKPRNDPPGIMPLASQLLCVALFPFCPAPSTHPLPYLVFANVCEIPIKPEKMGILDKTVFSKQTQR